jgi:hypothetical protein
MTPPEAPLSGGRTEAESTALFVSRLQRLLRLRSEHCDELNPQGIRLLDRAIYATYRDCIEYGAEQRARTLMEAHPTPGWDSKSEQAQQL